MATDEATTNTHAQIQKKIQQQINETTNSKQRSKDPPEGVHNPVKPPEVRKTNEPSFIKLGSNENSARTIVVSRNTLIFAMVSSIMLKNTLAR